MVYDFEPHLDVSRMTNYYRQRGDFQVERIDNRPVSAKKYLVRVADRSGNQPIGWIFENSQFYYDDWANLVDPIYAHQIKDTRIERIFGQKLISGGRFYFQTGFWKRDHLTIAAADVATHIVFINHCTNTTMCRYDKEDIARRCEYSSGPSMMTADCFNDMKNEVDSYEYFVFRIPDTEVAREVMLEITQENVTQKLKSMRAFQKYVTECKKYRPFFELLMPSAKERGLHLDLNTNVYRAILRNHNNEPIVTYCYAQKEYIDLSTRLVATEVHE